MITKPIERHEMKRWNEYQRYKKSDIHGPLWARVRWMVNLAEKMGDALDEDLRRAILAVEEEAAWYVNQSCYSIRPPYVSIEELQCGK